MNEQLSDSSFLTSTLISFLGNREWVLEIRAILNFWTQRKLFFITKRHFGREKLIFFSWTIDYYRQTRNFLIAIMSLLYNLLYFVFPSCVCVCVCFFVCLLLKWSCIESSCFKHCSDQFIQKITAASFSNMLMWFSILESKKLKRMLGYTSFNFDQPRRPANDFI